MKTGSRSIGLSGWLLSHTLQRLDSAATIAALVFLTRVGSAGATYLTQILFARWMGTIEYGKFVSAWTWVIVIGGLADLGFATTTLRFIPLYRASNEISLVRGILRTAYWFPILCGGIACALFLAVTYLGSNVFAGIDARPFYVGCLCVPLFVMASVQDGVARSHHWVMVGLVPEYIIRPLILLTLASVTIIAGLRLDAALAMSVALIATAIGVFAQRLVLNRRLSDFHFGEAKFEFQRWRKVSVSILGFVAFYLALNNVDVLMLNFFSGPAEVAVYFAASKTFALIAFVSFAVTTVGTARISELSAGGQNDEVERYFAKAIRWTFWPSLAGAVFILLIGRPLLSLFGPHFIGGYQLMFIMAAGMVIQASTGPAEVVLNMQGQEKACAQVYAASFAFGLAACAFLIPSLGAHGAAVAIAITLTFKSLLLFVLVKRRLSLHAFILKPT